MELPNGIITLFHRIPESHEVELETKELIICEECKHFDTDMMHKGYGFCLLLDTFRRPEGYCDLAEGKEE